MKSSTPGIASILFAGLLAACATAAPPQPAPGLPVSDTARTSSKAPLPGAEATGGDGVITLSRSACFGRCPQYTLTIAADGAVEFEGQRFVAALGIQRGTADPARLASLVSLLREPASRGLKDIYRPGQSGCVRYATDMPSTTLAWQLDGEQHAISHYLGCQTAPQRLRDIASAIDDAAGSPRWISQGVDR